MSVIQKEVRLGFNDTINRYREMNNIIKDEMINAKIEDLRSTHCSLMLPWAYFVFKICIECKDD